jgi:tetratricopeptide (TPR) repeat protein
MINKNPTKAKSFFKDKRINQSEKIILKCFYHLRDNKFDKAEVELVSISKMDDPVVEAIRLQLLGIVYNNISHFNEAEKCFLSTLDLLRGKELTYFEMVSLYNLFVIAYNEKDDHKMKRFITLMNKTPQNTIPEQLMFLRSKLDFYTFHSKFNIAHKVIIEIESKKDSFAECDFASYLLDKMTLFIKQENFFQAIRTLEEMKKYRKYTLSENYRFLKLLLENVVDNQPIYFSDFHFSRIPLLLYQMKTIRSFEENDLDSANKYWNKLNSISSSVYADNFEYKGDKCLFSIALKKYLDRLQEQKFNIPDGISQHTKIVSILSQAKTPVKKDLLFELVYNKKPITKDEYQTLAKAIHRLKKKQGLKIQFIKGCYSLIQS